MGKTSPNVARRRTSSHRSVTFGAPFSPRSGRKQPSERMTKMSKHARQGGRRNRLKNWTKMGKKLCRGDCSCCGVSICVHSGAWELVGRSAQKRGKAPRKLETNPETKERKRRYHADFDSYLLRPIMRMFRFLVRQEAPNLFIESFFAWCTSCFCLIYLLFWYAWTPTPP